MILIDDLDAQIAKLSAELKLSGVEHRYTPLLMTAPGIGWVLGHTIGAEIGEIERFASPTKLVGYTGLCPRVYQSGDKDRRGALTKAGPKYLRWAMLKATMHACRHPVYRDRYPFGIAPPQPASHLARSSRRGGDRDMSAAPFHPPHHDTGGPRRCP